MLAAASRCRPGKPAPRLGLTALLLRVRVWERHRQLQVAQRKARGAMLRLGLGRCNVAWQGCSTSQGQSGGTPIARRQRPAL